MMQERMRSLAGRLRFPVLVFALFAAALSPRADLAATPTEAPATTAVAAPAPTATPVPASFAASAGLSPQVLETAFDALQAARARGIAGRADRLTVIDYSRPSTEPRLWVLDLANGRVLFQELVAHGAGSGENYATQFSNTVDSRETSLGLFLTAGTYEGGNGYSLQLRGLDPGVNDRALERHIVMHGAPYVSAEFARQHGRLGRSWGCPALSLADARPVIDAIKGGSFVFSYADSTPRTQSVVAEAKPGTSSGPVTATATAAARR
jgi:L,D-transpeptidase catalytic domain